MSSRSLELLIDSRYFSCKWTLWFMKNKLTSKLHWTVDSKVRKWNFMAIGAFSVCLVIFSAIFIKSCSKPIHLNIMNSNFTIIKCSSEIFPIWKWFNRIWIFKVSNWHPKKCQDELMHIIFILNFPYIPIQKGEESKIRLYWSHRSLLNQSLRNDVLVFSTFQCIPSSILKLCSSIRDLQISKFTIEFKLQT